MSSISKIESKIYDLSKAGAFVKNCKSKGNKVVFTNGCFDLLHLGHLDYLSKARDLGDELIIGLNSTNSVSNLKGPNRPINDEKTRAYMLASLEFVSGVIVFDEPTPMNLILNLKPDVLVKGGDYTFDTIVGAEDVVKYGGKVEVIPFLEGYSTTNIVTKIQKTS